MKTGFSLYGKSRFLGGEGVSSTTYSLFTLTYYFNYPPK